MTYNTDEDVPLASLSELTAPERVSTQDEADYSTIVQLRTIVDAALEDCRDVRLVDLQHPKLSAEQQILAYQFAITAVLEPFKSQVDSAIDRAKKQGK